MALELFELKCLKNPGRRLSAKTSGNVTTEPHILLSPFQVYLRVHTIILDTVAHVYVTLYWKFITVLGEGGRRLIIQLEKQRHRHILSF